jgi:hypothetical protein
VIYHPSLVCVSQRNCLARQQQSRVHLCTIAALNSRVFALRLKRREAKTSHSISSANCQHDVDETLTFDCSGRIATRHDACVHVIDSRVQWRSQRPALGTRALRRSRMSSGRMDPPCRRCVHVEMLACRTGARPCPRSMPCTKPI